MATPPRTAVRPSRTRRDHQRQEEDGEPTKRDEPEALEEHDAFKELCVCLTLAS